MIRNNVVTFLPRSVNKAILLPKFQFHNIYHLQCYFRDITKRDPFKGKITVHGKKILNMLSVIAYIFTIRIIKA